MIEYVPANSSHIGRIAAAMGKWDRIECEAGGHSAKTGLRESFRLSSMAWSALIDGHPVAMWGVCAVNVLEGLGTPWMLGSDQARRHPKAFYVGGARTLPIMLRCFPRLENHVAVGNKGAIRLLGRWGFEVGGTVVTKRGVDFIPFVMDASRCANP